MICTGCDSLYTVDDSSVLSENKTMYFKWNFMLLLTTAKTFTIIQVNLKDNYLPLQCEWNEVIKIKPTRQIFFTNIPTIYHAINYNFSMEGNESPCECTRYWICLAWLTFYFIIITFSMALVLYVNHCQLFLFNNRQTFLKQTPIDMEWALFYLHNSISFSSMTLYQK